MSEKPRQHPQKPAEGAEEDVEASGVDKPGDSKDSEDANTEESPERTQREPAEGGEEEVEAPGVDRPSETG